jgi:pheromone receptor transcription factor
MAPAKSNGRPPSRGRQVIKIAYIENKAARQVTFSKRKAGIFKKASELALLCGAHITAIVFSECGKPYAFGSPSVDGVLRRFAPWLPGGEPCLEDDEVEPAAVEATLRRAEETAALVEAEQARLAAVGTKVLQAVAAPGKLFWWEADVHKLGEGELPAFHAALERLRGNVQRHADKLLRSDEAPVPVQ